MLLQHHLFSKYAKFSKKRTCAYQEARNISFRKILRTYQMDGLFLTSYEYALVYPKLGVFPLTFQSQESSGV